MLVRPKKQTQVLSKSYIYDASDSLIKVFQEQAPTKEGKRGRRKTPRKTERSSKSKERAGSRKEKSSNSKSKNNSSKKVNDKSKTPVSKKKSNKEHNQKVNSKSYKTIQTKHLKKQPERRQDKNPFSNKTSTSSTFKRPQINLNKRKSIDQKGIKSDKTYNAKGKDKNKLRKSKSQIEMDRITLSEIQAHAKKVGNKELNVIHEYFGADDQRISFLVKKQIHVKKSRTRVIDGNKRKGSQSCSRKKGSKSNIKNVNVWK